MKYFLLFLVSMVLSGCTVGRYVTNVSSRGPGKLAIEKCTTKKWDMFFWNTECRSTEVPLVLDNKSSKNDDKTAPTVSKQTNLINGNW